MKKTKNKKNIILLCSCTLLIASLGIVMLSSSSKESTNASQTSSSSEETTQQTGLNAKEIKFAQNGEYFELVANFPSSAIVKSVTFTSSDPESVSVTRINDTKARLTRLKLFTGNVIITAKNNDPYSSSNEATCKVRCYNNVISINDTYSALKDSNTYMSKTGAYLSVGTPIKIKMSISTNFGENEDAYTDGTFTNIESQDLISLKNQLVDIFTEDNTISDFKQKDNTSCDDNEIYFNLDYKVDIFNGATSLIKEITIGDTTGCIDLYPYVSSSNFTLEITNNNSTEFVEVD